MEGADYAIIVLKKTVTRNKSIQIAKLPPRNAKCHPFGHQMVVSGWGYDGYDKTRPTNKLWAVLQTCMPLNRCPNIRSRGRRYSVCAGDYENKKNSACVGDSGGRLVNSMAI